MTSAPGRSEPSEQSEGERRPESRERPAGPRRRHRTRGGEHADAPLEFRTLYDFELDPFQIEACRALEAGHGVLVAAPTGSGKTVVGEFAVHLALAQGRKCFYTTPIKALSNQKYADLVRRYGADRVGLLTGDNTVNGEAPVVVMTTEVLRNMLYAGSSTLAGLAYVVMDEVHYLADRFRGAVWEEVIIHLPESVRLVALSATVSNAEEFGEWLQEVRGDTTVIVDEHRPVPLWQHMLVGNRLYDLFVADGSDRGSGSGGHPDAGPGDDRLSGDRASVRVASPVGDGPVTDSGEDAVGAPRDAALGAAPPARVRVNPKLERVVRDDSRQIRDRRGRPGRGRGNHRPRRFRVPGRAEVIDRLDTAGLLPAITFIFSRAGCDAAVLQCLTAGLRLTTEAEAAQIRRHVRARTADLPKEDLAVLGYPEWLTGLERGLAAHHAGMLPTFKEIVEELFVRGLVKAVFATETLALGINMPARSVVIERLDKWNGETHADLTPGEYTQFTGRAGRRGIDIEGHAVVVWHPGVDPDAVAGLASTRTYPLNSSFRPSYNMAVNLVGQVGRERARGLLEASFAQFQADRAVVGLATRVRRNEEGLAGYLEAATCDRGDFLEYARLRRTLGDREKDLAKQRSSARRAEAVRSLERLRPGDVIHVPAGRRAGMAVVIDPGLARRSDGPAPLVLTVSRQIKRLSVNDFTAPVDPVERIRIPQWFSPRSARHRRDLASTLRTKIAHRDVGKPPREADRAGDDAEIDRLRREIRAHPCHGCPDREDHARWGERYLRLERETAGLRRRVDSRSQVIARTFDRVCAVLDQLGHLDGDAVTEEGRRLGRIYSELDLLTAESLRADIWADLAPAELAACVSALVYESRQADDNRSPRTPHGRVREALNAMLRLWGELDEIEKDHRLSFLREPDLGFAWAAYRWAKGDRLDAVLDDTGLAAGDFVRWIRQLLDLLGQLHDAAPVDSPVRQSAPAAMDALRRGVVAYTSVT